MTFNAMAGRYLLVIDTINHHDWSLSPLLLSFWSRVQTGKDPHIQLRVRIPQLQ